MKFIKQIFQQRFLLSVVAVIVGVMLADTVRSQGWITKLNQKLGLK